MTGWTRRPRIRRLLAAAVLAVVALAGPTSVAAAGDFTMANGVTWSIDHGAKTITADIRITLTAVCSPSQQLVAAVNPVGRQCTVSQEVADAIKANIEKIWNNGNKYYCYDIVVHVDIKIEDKPVGDPSGRVRVQVDQSGVGVRSYVSSVGKRGGTWNGSTPDDAGLAVNKGLASSTWAYPPVGSNNANLYAHEAGHILGLDDGYEDYVGADGKTYSRPRAGAVVDDLMTHQKNGRIDKTTLRRMVERQGYRKTELKCNYKIDQASFGGRINGTKCDPLGGIWRAHGTYSVGRANGSQDWAVSINETTRKGVFDYTDHQVADFIPGLVVTTDGTAFGDATITVDDELFVHMHLVEQWHTYHATTTKGGTGNDQNAAPTSADLTWEPIGKCPP